MQWDPRAESRESPESVLVDTRSSAHFHGWPEEGQREGGHLLGAVHFSAAWADACSEAELEDLLKERGLERDLSLRLYGADAPRLANALERLAWPKVEVDTEVLRGSRSQGVKLHAVPHFERLVHPEWLAALVRGEAPPNAPLQPPLLLEAGWQTERAYREAHLPGALYIDTSWLEERPCWSRVPDPRLRSVLLSLGVQSTRPVIVYSRNTLAAARVAHLLRYAGVEDVRLLDGGKGAWIEAGFDLERGPSLPMSAEDWLAPFPARPELFLDTPSLKRRLSGGPSQVLCVRSWQEFIGETSGYPDFGKRGRIPGSMWAYGGSDANHMEDFRSPDKRMRSACDLAKRWRAAGIRSDLPTSVYCGTAWRASEVAFYSALMGWPEVAVYDGGWRLWASDTRNPIAKGLPLKQRSSRVCL